jgi:Ion channel
VLRHRRYGQMVLLTKLTLALSQVHPLVYLLTFLTAIPAFAFLYVFVAPQGFYAPNARYEPSAVSDTLQLASILEGALHRSFDARTGQELVVGNWKLDLGSLRVDNVYSTDGTKLSFRVSFSADGIGTSSGAKQVGWSIIVTVSEHPTHAIISDRNAITTYRIPDVDFSNYASPFKEEYEELFKLVFGQKEFFVASSPALALSGPEELRFRRYLLGVKGDPSSISGDLPRMIYLSAVVITTLGFGDILPITPKARILVAMEAITGIVFAGLFLNALAYHAISTLGLKRGSESGAATLGDDN